MRTALTSAVAALAVLAACAHPAGQPHPQPAAGADCTQLERDLAELKKGHQEAAAKQSDAWKAIVPFAVIGRYASGKAAQAQAEQDIAAREAEMQRQGCVRHGA